MAFNRPLLRHFSYVSDAKVDMLLGQMPTPIKKKLAVELKVEFKVLSATLKGELEQEASNRYSRLQAVEAYLRETAPIGTVDSPAEYIHDSLDVHTYEQSEIVVWAGFKLRSALAMFGSAHHVLGARPRSFSDAMMMGMLYPSSSIAGFRNYLSAAKSPDLAGERANDLLAIWLLAGGSVPGMPPPPFDPKMVQRVEFLAKRLGRIESEIDRRSALLVSPLYVAIL